MDEFMFPYNKYNVKTAQQRDFDSEVESFLTRYTASELIRVFAERRSIKYMSDVAFKKLPSELIDAASRPDIEKRLFFTHSDPFFSAGVLLRYCCFKSSEIHLSQFISMFLNEFKRVDSIQLTKRMARLIIGIPEFWDLKSAIEYSTTMKGKAPDVVAELDDSDTEYYKYEINLEVWTEFASEWDLLSGMKPGDWINGEKSKIVNDFLLSLLEYVEGNKMLHLFVSTLVSAQAQHGSIGKRCECAACINMLHTFMILQIGPKTRISSGSTISRLSQPGGRFVDIALGYWPKDVYLRILPFLYVEPRWKNIIEQLYELETIDMASFMDNLFLDPLKLILTEHPLLMRDIVLDLLKDDHSDGDRIYYEQAARDIIIFSVVQTNFTKCSDALYAIKMNMSTTRSEGFFDTILEQIRELKHSTSESSGSGSKEPECKLSGVSTSSPSPNITDSLIADFEKLIQGGSGPNFAKLDSSFIDRLVEAAEECDIEEGLMFTEHDAFFMAGRQLNTTYSEIDGIYNIFDQLKEKRIVELEQRTPRIFVGLLVDTGVWKSFRDEWKVLITALNPPYTIKTLILHCSIYELRVEMRQASQFLSRIITLADARSPALSKLLITSLMVANLQPGLERHHNCFAERCQQCGSMMDLFRILAEHYMPDMESIPVRVVHFEHSPRLFEVLHINAESIEAKIEAYSEWYGIVANLYDDGRVDVGSFIYNMYVDSYDLLPLLCTRPQTLLFEYIVKVLTIQNSPGYSTNILIESLELALVIVQNPSKFKWIGDAVDHPTVDAVFSMYSALFGALFDLLQPSHRFFVNLDVNIARQYETSLPHSNSIINCEPFITVINYQECVREFLYSQMDLHRISRARRMNRA